MGPFFIVILVIVLIVLLSCINVVPQAKAFVVERLGGYQTTWGVGVHFKTPIIDRVAKKVILKEQVVDFAPQPVITKDNVTMRTADAEIITQVAAGEALDIVEIRDDGWIKVYLDDEEVYVSGEFVEVKSDLATAITMTELLYGQGVSDVRVDLCQYAKQFLGNPYVWGGTSLTSGADCSGFVLSVFSKYGVSLPHSSRAQANQGTSISASELKPGDLVFYAKGGTINHVAIYIGGGQVIHASSPKTGIKISAYNYRTPHKMVRILYD